MSLSRNVLYFGSEAPVLQPVKLQAGPLSLVFALGQLWYVRLGDREILRRIYVAVRDRDWLTVPPVIKNLSQDVKPDSFHMTFEVENQQGDIDFFWRASVTGQLNGTLSFAMQGVARSTFLTNRIGFGVLHSFKEWAGRACTVEKINGEQVQGAFPKLISPHQVFSDMRSISHEVLPGVCAQVRFEGETYEMEDQRNWSDASFKTYCPPLCLPFPRKIEAGTAVSQSVTLTLQGDWSSVETHPADESISVTLATAPTLPLPKIGLGLSSQEKSLSATAVRRLSALKLSHLRVDLRPFCSDYESVLQQAATDARQIGTALEVALFLTDNARREIKDLRAALDLIQPLVCRWLVFHVSEKSTTPKWLDLARVGLNDYEPSAKFGGGTDECFAELNRFRPTLFGIDLVGFSLNPQVHAFDHVTLVENLQAQGSMIQSAREFCHGRSLAVTPITLRPRFNPNATGPEAISSGTGLPLEVDPRQMSLFGAGWTLGTLKHLSEAGVYCTTFYETVGWRGVMERQEGSRLPTQFPSLPNSVFPLYHVFADVGEFAGGAVVPSQSSSPLQVESFSFSCQGRLRILLANLNAKKCSVRLVTGSQAGSFCMKVLDETNAEHAMTFPESFRSAPGKIVNAAGPLLEIELPPLGVVRLDPS